ncbi:hypothetical protein ACWYAT_13690 [Sphingobacterium multivorum]
MRASVRVATAFPKEAWSWWTGVMWITAGSGIWTAEVVISLPGVKQA